MSTDDQDGEGSQLKPEQETRNRIRLQILSHPRYASPARDFVYRIALLQGFSRESAYDLKIVCGEALNNIIRHAYREERDRPIFIEVLMHAHYLEIRFRDFGIQTPIGPNLARDLSDYRERGLGLYLLDKLTDYHHFDQNFKQGTRLTIKKRID